LAGLYFEEGTHNLKFIGHYAIEINLILNNLNCTFRDMSETRKNWD
jgi:hypothetical protein